ncbi:ubiquitin ligase (cullin) of SCF [Coemansia sp. RSA 1813]|nr:ubiquitin ligase (cullin) of SCF [Coemansia sp. RSA 1843]KAJ2085764.1 ubiquitin ligase (cullin) of SCF [Coemansia sp. RSA 986]KAJ2210636.1 ubiquitin ligase (cullin) of SCF [Coemansia sp. RSA 487]KAJ2563381.1 ubiquitin ligase (cullin) of SCF [Coemansia sp. RSA 1813]
MPFDYSVFIDDSLTLKDYMHIYTAVHGTPKTFDSGKELYIWFTDTTIAIARRICNGARTAVGATELLKYYLAKWAHFQRVVSLFGEVLESFQRDWYKAECEANPSYVSIGETMHQLWYTFCFKPLHERLEDAVISMVRKERNNVAIDSTLMQRYWTALIELHPPKVDEIRPLFRINLGAYTKFYEEPYISEALMFIEHQTRGLGTKENIRRYISKLHVLIESEMRRGELYLHPGSLQFVLPRLISDYFVRGHMSKHISDDAIKMLKDPEKTEDLLRPAFLLLQGLNDPQYLEELESALRDHMRDNIIRTYSSIGGSSEGAESNVIDIILSTHDANLSMLKKYFGPAVPEVFMFAAKDALSMAINSEGMDVNALVEYYHRHLKKSAAKLFSGNEDIDHAVRSELDRAAEVAKTLKNKDMFIALYHLQLARRLVRDDYISLDLETHAIRPFVFDNTDTKLKLKVEDMCKDIISSKDRTQDFLTLLDKQSLVLPVDSIQVQFFKSASWPEVMVPNVNDLVIPSSLEILYNKFAEFYEKSDDGRKRSIWWSWALSSVTIHLYFPHAPKVQYTLMVNMYQLAILTLFTEPSIIRASGPISLTKDKIIQLTGISNKRLDTELAVLQRARIITRKAAAENGELTLNSKFNSKVKRINLYAAQRKQKMDEARVAKSTANSQKEQTIAEILAILKRNKRMSHTALFNEVAEGCKGRFVVSKSEFKSSIEELLKIEELKRDDNEKDIYIYV